MRSVLILVVAVVFSTLGLTATASAQDAVIGTVTSDPATVPAAGEYTLTATGANFIPDTQVVLTGCISPSDTLVPGSSDIAEITSAAQAINALADCDLASALPVDVDGDGAWSASLTADVGDNFFLSAGALDGSQAGATWVAIVGDGSGEQEPAEEEPAEEAAEEDAAEDLAETGVETALLAVIGAAVVGGGAIVTREARRHT